MTYTAIFHRIPLLSDLPRQEREYLVSVLSTIRLEPGEVLFREGEPGESLYAVLEGRMDVLLGCDTPNETLLASLGPGEFIGEMSLLIPGRIRTATIRAATQARLWKMTKADFDALMVRQPQLAYSMVQTLTRRLEATNAATFRTLQEKNQELQTAYDELKAAQALLIEKERLERELQLAAEIQNSILPQALPVLDHFSFGALIQPARQVGGDFFDIFELAESRLGVVVGDVADKGVPSAIFMARTHALIMAEAEHGGSPGEVLRRVNKHLIRLQQSDLFVTVLLGFLDLPSGIISIARAGHELPLILDRAGRVHSLPQTRGQPVGLFEDLLLDERTLRLEKGETLVMFSDGLTDCRNPQGETFGKERLWAALGDQKGCSGAKVCSALIEALSAFRDRSPQDDDITVVALSHLP